MAAVRHEKRPRLTGPVIRGFPVSWLDVASWGGLISNMVETVSAFESSRVDPFRLWCNCEGSGRPALPPSVALLRLHAAFTGCDRSHDNKDVENRATGKKGQLTFRQIVKPEGPFLKIFQSSKWTLK